MALNQNAGRSRYRAVLRLVLLMGALGSLVFVFRLPGMPVTFLTFCLALMFAIPVTVRQSIMDQMNGRLHFPSADPADFPLLDVDTMKRYEAELGELGFVPVKYFRWDSASKRAPTGFARQFIHPGHHCIAEITQFFYPNGKTLPIFCTVISWFGTEGLEEDERVTVARAPLADPNGEILPLPPVRGYSYGTHNRKQNALYNMLRHDHALTTQMIGATSSELLKTHLEQRQKVAAVLGQPPVSGDLSTISLAFSRRLREEIGQRLSRRDPWTSFWGAIFEGTKRTEWLGDLEGKLKN